MIRGIVPEPCSSLYKLHEQLFKLNLVHTPWLGSRPIIWCTMQLMYEGAWFDMLIFEFCLTCQWSGLEDCSLEKIRLLLRLSAGERLTRPRIPSAPSVQAATRARWFLQ